MDRRRWMALGGAALAALVVLGFWGRSQYVARASAQASLTGQYQRAFYAALDNIQNVHVLLGKARVAADKAQLADLFSQVRAQAFAAQENLAQVPVPDAMAARTPRLLTQTGDFAAAMLRQTAQGRVPDAKQEADLAGLYRQAGTLNRQLRQAADKSGPGRLYLADGAAQSRAGGKSAASRDLAAVDSEMQKYPGLIYNGPFSDNPARGVTKLPGPPTSPDQAGAIAVGFLDRLGGVQYRATYDGMVKGDLPSYRVVVSPLNSKADAQSTVDVTTRGGKVVWYLDPRPVAGSTWSLARARGKAVSFLAQRGLGTFVPDYYRVGNNVATFNLVPVESGVKVYPRQVRVAVAMDNGQVVGFEGTDYLAGNGLKPSNKVVLDAAQAARLVKAGLAGGPGSLALIPDGRGGELYAYEFSGKHDGATYLVYINAQNGREERILRVADAPGGRLTI